MSKPQISFVVPTRNRIEWIGECIGSLLSQSLQEIEIIVVDDGSDDGTNTFLGWFADKDPRVTVLTNERPMGAGRSRNRGNEHAKADIIAICDDDDIYPIERAEKTVEFFTKNPSVHMMNAPYVRIGYHNEVLENFDGEGFDVDRFKADGSINYFAHPTAAYWRKDILEVPYRPETDKVTDDYQLVCDWIAAGKTIGFAPGDYLCMHRVLPKSMMAGLRGFDPKWVRK